MNPSTPIPSPRNTSPKWLLPALIAGSLAILGGLVFAVIFGVLSILKSTDPYQHALTTAIADPQVQSAIGTPIAEGWLPVGSVNTTNDSGSASFKIPISGPKGEAVIWLEAERTRKIWTYPTLEVAVQGQPNPIKLTP